MAQETYDPHRSTTEVRSGDRRQMNLRVLLLSGAAIIVAFVLIYVFAYPFGPPSS